MSISTAQALRTDAPHGRVELAISALQWARQLSVGQDEATAETAESTEEDEADDSALASERSESSASELPALRPESPSAQDWLLLSVAQVRGELDRLL
ncbi:MAG TPA: hypothetical protein VMF89_13160, partial [Polyangiales bacterium]|nr:hypothetical protein [Polyangiales bacterium]